MSDDSGVASRGCESQRSLAFVIGRLYVCSSPGQEFYQFFAAVRRRIDQKWDTAIGLDVRVSAVCQQHFRNVQISGLRGYQKRNSFIVGFCVGLGALRKEKAHHRGFVLFYRNEQWRPALFVLSFQPSAPCDQKSAILNRPRSIATWRTVPDGSASFGLAPLFSST